MQSKLCTVHIHYTVYCMKCILFSYIQQKQAEKVDLTLDPSRASLSNRVQESGVTRELSGGGLESADQTRVGNTGFSREVGTLGQLCRDLARSSRSSFLPSVSAKARMTS